LTGLPKLWDAYGQDDRADSIFGGSWMSTAAASISLRDRLAGKWQIPALLGALALLAGSVLRIKPPQARIPMDVWCERITGQIEGEMYSLAISDCQALLAYVEEHAADHEPEDTGRVKHLLVRAKSLRARELGFADVQAAQEILDLYEEVVEARQALDWQDHRHLAAALERLGRVERAIAEYGLAIPEAGAESLDLRRRVIELQQSDTLADRTALLSDLEQLILDAADRRDIVHWATVQLVDLLSEHVAGNRARQSLARLEEVLRGVGLADWFEFLDAWVLYRSGEFEECESRLRALRNRLTVQDEVYPSSGWLLGRVVLFDDGPKRPTEAMSFFRDVVASRNSGLYVDASWLGMAEALGLLERYDESLEYYVKVLPGIGDYQGSSVLNAGILRASMTVTGERLREKGDYRRALELAELAMELVPVGDNELLGEYLRRVGDWSTAMGRSLKDEAQADSELSPPERAALVEEGRQFLRRAGEYFFRLAQLTTLNDDQSAQAMWNAADLYAEAGDSERTIELLRQFIQERPHHAMTSPALMRLGQSLQAAGRYSEAIEAYQENHRRFPLTPDAMQALIPLALCFMALGPEHYSEAEATFRDILENSEVFTPEAPEFAEALFLFGDLLSRERRFEDAIPRLKEALERYPDHERVMRGEFLLADAYRQSGLALRDDLSNPEFVGEKPRLRAEYVERVNRAAELFGGLVEHYEELGDSSLDQLGQLLLKDARMYEADCLFELGRYEAALNKYDRAAWIYRDTPTALAAYVQIINCHIHLGSVEDAQAALRRARHQLSVIPEADFTDSALTGTLREWDQYFGWLEQSALLSSS
jgi:tetratricopeptide (TPR) repeat protein